MAAPLAAGNVVILKPPEQAPLSTLRLAELVGSIFPPGVLNVLPGGRECGQALTVHPLVKKITLIGSVSTGQAIQRAASETLKPTLLELGGKNALIAFDDADPTDVADAALRGMNFMWGQRHLTHPIASRAAECSSFWQLVSRVVRRLESSCTSRYTTKWFLS
jgi:betaine-aldehyde dehydrogenase